MEKNKKDRRPVHREYYKLVGRDISKSRLDELTIVISVNRIHDPITGYLSDSDPKLIEIMQSIYDENFKFFKLQFAGAEISFLEPEFIEKWKHGLTEYILKPACNLEDRIEAKRLLSFFEGKGNPITTKPPDGGKPVKTFPQYLTNYIPDDKKELFAEKLRTEFCTERNLPFRYMLEGLKEHKLLNWYVHGERADFYRSIKAYFNRDIGAITGIFDKTDIDKTDIDKAKERINPIFLEVNPSM
jgi:hypothetical protein